MRLYKTSYENIDHHRVAIWTTSFVGANDARSHLKIEWDPDQDSEIRTIALKVPTTSKALCEFLNYHGSAWNEGEEMNDA